MEDPVTRERMAPMEGVAFNRVMHRLVYPELRDIAPALWPDALRRARALNLDVAERLGILASIAIVTYILQWVDNESWGILTHYLAQFVLALPLLAVLVAPWLLRRTRRGLRNEAARLYGGHSC